MFPLRCFSSFPQKMFSLRCFSSFPHLKMRKVSGISISPLDTFLQPRELPMSTLVRISSDQLPMCPLAVSLFLFGFDPVILPPTWRQVLSVLRYPQLYRDVVNHYSNPESWMLCDEGAEEALKAIRSTGIKVGARSRHPLLASRILEQLNVGFDVILSDRDDAAKVMAVERGEILTVTSYGKNPIDPVDSMNVVWGRDVKTLSEVAALAGVIV